MSIENMADNIIEKITTTKAWGDDDFLDAAAETAAKLAAQPVAVPHDYRTIKISDGQTMIIDVEELKRQAEKAIFQPVAENGA